MASSAPRKVGRAKATAPFPPELIVFLTRSYNGVTQVFVPRFSDEAITDVHSITTYTRPGITPVSSAAAWCQCVLGWPIKAERFQLITLGGGRGGNLPSLAVAALPDADSKLPLSLSKGHYGDNTARFWWDLLDLLHQDHATAELRVWVQILRRHLNASR